MSEKHHFLWALVRLRVRLGLLDSVIDFLSKMPLTLNLSWRSSLLSVTS